MIVFENMRTYGWMVDRAPQIPRGNYNISKILLLIKNRFNLVFSNRSFNLKIYSDQYRVAIIPNGHVAIACYANLSILQLIGF